MTDSTQYKLNFDICTCVAIQQQYKLNFDICTCVAIPQQYKLNFEIESSILKKKDSALFMSNFI